MFFSPLLTDAGQTPPRNHKEKLSSVVMTHPNLLDGYHTLGFKHFVARTKLLAVLPNES
jgi:hypothetical protein